MLESEKQKLEQKCMEEEEKHREKNLNFLDDEKELNKLTKEIKHISSEIEKYKTKEGEFEEKLEKVRLQYAEALKSYGDSGNSKILSHLEKTYNILTDGKDMDMEEIIEVVEAKNQEVSEEELDVAVLRFGKRQNGVI